MQINFSPKVNNVSFKQINLSASEYKDCQNLFKKSLSDSFDLNNRDELFDVFEPHLNREVELKHFKTEKCRRFFAASLYVKFFKMLESCIAYNTGFDSLVDKLNNYCENFVELEQTNNEPSYTNFNVSSVENRAHDLYKYLGMTREDFLKKNQRFPILQSKSVEELKQDVAYVVEKLGFDEEEYIRILTRNFPAIAYSGTSLVEIAQKTMETLEIKELDEFRTLVKINPALLTPHDLAENIADIASFLDVDESRVKEAIKYYSLLATYRIENVKSNFYAMKDYLKVDREKMVDLALLNTAMLTCDLDKNKKRYEDVAGILGILPETFIKKANLAPTMHLMHPKKLELYLDFVSKKLNLNREASIEYILQNMNLLSYRFDNIVVRTENNRKILNEELGIDDSTYTSMLMRKSWIMDAKEDLIRQNIKEACEYFKIDKKTYSKMAVRYPRMLTAYVSNIDKNISEISADLNIEKNKYKQMCVAEPILVVRTPKYFKEDVNHNVNLLRISFDSFVELAKENPALLAKRFDTASEMYSLFK